jgi:monoamine oxidase
MDADVVVIGAGAAGIAAARALRDSQNDVLVIDARHRIGGRVFTHRSPGITTAIELGAEFIHGRAVPLDKTLRAAALTTVDMSGSRWQSTRTHLHPFNDFWERLDRVMRLLPGGRGTDRSFQEFISARPGGSRLAAERTSALQYVESFHAADPRLVSAQVLADAGSPGDDERERRIGRVLGGYDRVIEWMAAPLDGRIRLSALVTRVTWRPGRVVVDVQQPDGRDRQSIESRAAIITVPLGVLKASPGERGAIEFSPPLSQKRDALEHLAVGSVVRVAFLFTERFWAEEWFAKRVRSDAFDLCSFIHTHDPHFPVWWTAYPLLEPVMVGWSGGIRARQLSGRTPEQIQSQAIASLARVLHVPQRRIESLVAGAWMHDWEHDPFARGAYSYQMVGGSDAPKMLARPIQRTLFFAGEASDSEGSTGTVHGAIATGQRAAAQVLRVLR